MEQKHNYNLIGGDFEPSDARSVLFTLVNSKINFHSMQSFGITVKTSGDTSFHENRIKELTQINTEIKKVMDYATNNNLRLRINGAIEIKLINKPF